MGTFRLASQNRKHIIMRAFVALSALVAVGMCEEAKVVAAPLAYAGYPYGGYPVTYAAAPAPVTYAAAPVAAAPVVAPYAAPAYTGSQFHAQDEFGNLNYGYANINSAKNEVGNTYGGVTGGYSYVDANGQLQRVEYIADGAGFRVADSRLPVAPTFNPEPLVAPTFNPEPLVAPVYDGVAPEPVQDTPEVAEAKAAHLAAVAAAEAGERRRREADPAVLAGASRVLTAPTPLIHNPPVRPVVSYAGLPYAGYAGYAGYGYAAGLPYVL